MLASKLLAGTGSPNLQFVGGRSALSTSATPSFLLTGLSGGVASAPAAGDIVIACVAFRLSGDENIECTTSGYTEVADLYISDIEGRTHLGVYYKVLSAPDTSVAFRVDGITVDCTFATHVWRGVGASPLDVPSTTAVSGDSGRPNAPAITAIRSDVVVIAVGAATGGAGAKISALTVPSGMGNFFTQREGEDAAIGIASASPLTPSTYNPEPFGGGTLDVDASWAAVTLALRPA